MKRVNVVIVIVFLLILISIGCGKQMAPTCDDDKTKSLALKVYLEILIKNTFPISPEEVDKRLKELESYKYSNGVMEGTMSATDGSPVIQRLWLDMVRTESVDKDTGRYVCKAKVKGEIMSNETTPVGIIYKSELTDGGKSYMTSVLLESERGIPSLWGRPSVEVVKKLVEQDLSLYFGIMRSEYYWSIDIKTISTEQWGVIYDKRRTYWIVDYEYTGECKSGECVHVEEWKYIPKKFNKVKVFVNDRGKWQSSYI
jgi:hypothetical protein